MIEQNHLQPLGQSQLKVRVSPSGLHIFDRNTGLNVLLDELLLSPTLWAEAPQQVSIALTNACDLSCPFCYAPKNTSELDVERVKSWLDELDINGCICVGFGGGEPTLYPHLAELCCYVVRNTGLAVTFTTHGHHLNDNLIATLAGNVHFIRVSMDGIGTTYESLRNRSFAALRRHLEDVRFLAPFGINYVVNANTLPDLDIAIALATEIGATEFLLLPQQPTKRSNGIDTLTTKALQQWVSLYQGGIPLLISEVGSEDMPTCNPVAREKGLSAYAHIDATGVLKRSSFECDGLKIEAQGVMQALKKLRIHYKENSQ